MAHPGKFFSIMFSEWGSGLSGPASVPFAILALFATEASQKFAYGLLAVILGFFSAYRIWAKEKAATDAAQLEVASLKKRYFDDRPLLGIETHSVEGPNIWREHPAPVTFSIHHLSGRVPTAIRFEPILSLLGKFSLHFDSVPHAEKHPIGIGYRVSQVGAPPLSAHDLEKIGNIEGTMLRFFLDDSPAELMELSYPLVAHFKDGGAELLQSFRLTFDKGRFRFLPNTAI